jgi:hypothetical protein
VVDKNEDDFNDRTHWIRELRSLLKSLRPNPEVRSSPELTAEIKTRVISAVRLIVGRPRWWPRPYQEVQLQAVGRLRRAENKYFESRKGFLTYTALSGDDAEAYILSISLIGVGDSDSNRHEQLHFIFEKRPENKPLLILGQSPTAESAGIPHRSLIEIDVTDAYWWCSSGKVVWLKLMGGLYRPLHDDKGNSVEDFEGCRQFMEYSGPATGRIEAWRRGSVQATQPQWDDQNLRLVFGELLCRQYTVLSETSFTLCGQAEQPFGRRLDFLLRDAGA